MTESGKRNNNFDLTKIGIAIVIILGAVIPILGLTSQAAELRGQVEVLEERVQQLSGIKRDIGVLQRKVERVADFEEDIGRFIREAVESGIEAGLSEARR